MANGQIKSIIIVIIILLFLAVPITVSIENGLSHPNIEVIEGEDVNATESIQIQYQPYDPKSIVRLVNDSTVDSSFGWYIWSKEYYVWSGTATRDFGISIINVSAIRLGLEFTNYDNPIHVSLFSSVSESKNSTYQIENQRGQISLEVPIEEFEYGQDDSFLSLSVTIRLVNCSWDDLEFTSFWIDVITTEVLFPITIDVQRTNEESLFSNPNMRILRGSNEPKIVFESINDSLPLRRINETILLPPDNYTLWMNWNEDLVGEISLFNSSATLTLKMKCVRVDAKLTQDVPGYFISFGDYWEDIYEDHLLVHSPYFYFPPEFEVSVEIDSWISPFEARIYASTVIMPGENQNITLMVNPGLISVGDISISNGRMFIAVSSILFVIAVILVSGRKLTSSTKVIPFLFLFAGMVFPWMHVSKYGSWASPTPPGDYWEFWGISPAIFTSFGSADDFSIIIGPTYRASHLSFQMLIGVASFLLLIIMFAVALPDITDLSFILEIFDIGSLPKVSIKQVAFLLSLTLLLEILYIDYSLYGYSMGWYGSFSVGTGFFLTVLSIISFAVLVSRQSYKKPKD
ncbi:MAG: hypothetical protein ACFFE6_08505 [Candidatus Thorarchaeota archaeon]